MVRFLPVSSSRAFSGGHVVTSIFLLKNLATPPRANALRLGQNKSFVITNKFHVDTGRSISLDSDFCRSKNLVWAQPQKIFYWKFYIPAFRLLHTSKTLCLFGRTNKKTGLTLAFLFVRPVGIEPTTLSLKGSCSTDWATGGYCNTIHEKIQNSRPFLKICN